MNCYLTIRALQADEREQLLQHNITRDNYIVSSCEGELTMVAAGATLIGVRWNNQSKAVIKGWPQNSTALWVQRARCGVLLMLILFFLLLLRRRSRTD